MSELPVGIDTTTLASGPAHITVSGEIDMGNADAVEQRLEAALHGVDAAVIDLDGVAYLDSRGVRVLCDVADRVRWRGVLVVFAAPPDGVAGEVLAIAGLTQALVVHPSADAAERALLGSD